MSAQNALRVGLISDTHGLLRPEARAFAGACDYIIHGGDIGSAAILDELSAMAPLIAVKGNNDRQALAANRNDSRGGRVHLRHPRPFSARYRTPCGRRARDRIGSLSQAVDRTAERYFVCQSWKWGTPAILSASLCRRDPCRRHQSQGANR